MLTACDVTCVYVCVFLASRCDVDSAAACTQATPMLSLPWAPDPLAPELSVGRRVEAQMVTKRRVSIVQTAAPHDQITRWLQQSEEEEEVHAPNRAAPLLEHLHHRHSLLRATMSNAVCVRSGVAPAGPVADVGTIHSWSDAMYTPLQKKSK